MSSGVEYQRHDSDGQLSRSTITMMAYLARASSQGSCSKSRPSTATAADRRVAQQLHEVIAQDARRAVAQRRQGKGKLRQDLDTHVALRRHIDTLTTLLQSEASVAQIERARAASAQQQRAATAEAAARALGVPAPHRQSARESALSVMASLPDGGGIAAVNAIGGPAVHPSCRQRAATATVRRPQHAPACSASRGNQAAPRASRNVESARRRGVLNTPLATSAYDISTASLLSSRPQTAPPKNGSSSMRSCGSGTSLGRSSPPRQLRDAATPQPASAAAVAAVAEPPATWADPAGAEDVSSPTSEFGAKLAAPSPLRPSVSIERRSVSAAAASISTSVAPRAAAALPMPHAPVAMGAGSQASGGGGGGMGGGSDGSEMQVEPETLRRAYYGPGNTPALPGGGEGFTVAEPYLFSAPARVRAAAEALAPPAAAPPSPPPPTTTTGDGPATPAARGGGAEAVGARPQTAPHVTDWVASQLDVSDVVSHGLSMHQLLDPPAPTQARATLLRPVETEPPGAQHRGGAAYQRPPSGRRRPATARSRAAQSRINTGELVPLAPKSDGFMLGPQPRNANGNGNGWQ